MFEFKTIVNAIKNLNWKKYFYKNLLICFSILFLFFCVVVFVIGNGYRNVVENEINKYSQEISNNVKDSCEKITDSIMKIQNELLIKMDSIIFFASKPTESSEYAKSVTEVENIMHMYMGDSGIENVYVYSAIGDYILSSNSALLTNNYRDLFLDNSWIDEYEKTKERFMLRNVKIKNTMKEYLTIVMPCEIKYMSGLIAYNIDLGQVRSALNENINSINIVYDNVVCTIDREKSKLQIDKNTAHELINNYGKNKTDNGITVLSLGLQTADCMAFIEIDSSDYNQRLRNVKLIIGLMIIIIAMVAAAWAFWIVMKYYDNLLNLVLIVDNKKPNNDKKPLAEVVFVKNKILSMMDKNTKIENELERYIDMMNKTKIATLQNQINPHFLYNTLNLISLIDMKEHKRDTDTVKAIHALSDILRYAMNSKSYMVPLRDEIEVLKKYIYIQSLKYKDRFDIELDIDEDTLDLKVLKMTIQPLLENSVFHGILPVNRKCKIKISSYVEDGMLKIKGEDDGVGIPEETLVKLKDNVNGEVFDMAHAHGLSSVNQRCILLFGEKYGCEIISKERGTTIIVKYPILTDGDKK